MRSSIRFFKSDRSAVSNIVTSIMMLGMRFELVHRLEKHH
jgi:hypothetical protein